MDSLGTRRGAAGCNLRVSLMTNFKYLTSLRLDSPVTPFSLKTSLTSACALSITFGFLNNSDIAHSNVEKVVSLPALKISKMTDLMLLVVKENDIFALSFSFRNLKRTSTKSSSASPCLFLDACSSIIGSSILSDSLIISSSFFLKPLIESSNLKDG
uniref:Uncharacterized protein n=1 Tax=Opuntia streptacantha TaxID=393608 RepID=A0A7C9A255_OPUST